jgi:hypothetical protein
MKNIQTTLSAIALLFGLTCVPVAQAAPPQTQAAGDLIYLGVKGGFLTNDASGADYAINLGVYGGYNILGDKARYPKNLGGGTLSIEGELSLSAIRGDAGPDANWKSTVLAGYAAYRFPLQNSLFLKGKAGLYWADTSVDTPANWDGTDSGLSLGVGLGWKVGSGDMEAEITFLGSDLAFFSLGYIF